MQLLSSSVSISADASAPAFLSPSPLPRFGSAGQDAGCGFAFWSPAEFESKLRRDHRTLRPRKLTERRRKPKLVRVSMKEFVLSSGGFRGCGGSGKMGNARGLGRIHGLGAGAVALRKVRPVHVHAAPDRVRPRQNQL